MTIERDTEALVNLAVKSRPGWTSDTDRAVRTAIADAVTVGLGWPTIVRRLVALMLIDDSEPGELVTHEDRRQADADYRTHAARARAGITEAAKTRGDREQ